MSVYTYVRTSDIEVLEAGETLEDTLAHEELRIHTFALNEGVNISKRFVDSGVKWVVEFAERPAARDMLEQMEAGDSVIACTVERVFSSCEDMLETIRVLRKKQASLFIVDLNGDVTSYEFAPRFHNQLKIFNNLEKRRSTERIKTVKQNQRVKGRFLGGSRPFGYQIGEDGNLIENPKEQQVLKKILDMKARGCSLRAISTEVSTPVTPISFKTVQRLIKRYESSSFQ